MAMIGKPVDRIDGRLKVTGAAKYAAEFNRAGMAYAFPVRSTVAKGTLIKIDAAQAAKSPGVALILTHENAPRLKPFDREALKKAGAFLGEDLIPLQDNQIHYFGQMIALVVAETYEQARYAAALVKAEYRSAPPKVDLEKESANGILPEKDSNELEAQTNPGKAAALLAAAPHKIGQVYQTSHEVHNPMEPHASVAVWEAADKLTIHDATQGVMMGQAAMAYFFDLKPENVRIICPFVGGGFGTKAQPWSNNFLAAMAAQVLKRPVKLVITRQMMQSSVGRRSATVQTVALGAGQDGKLQVIRHHSDSYSNLSKFFEPSGRGTKVLYGAPVREITHRVTELNLSAPTFMRAPGEASGVFAVESAIDEMAYELKIDPLEFRRMNHTTVDPLEKHPFSGENLLECYRIGAEKFGWAKRKTQPRQTRSGNYLVGMGMATATYPGNRSSTTARIIMTADGTATVQCGTQDLGTGTYTILAQTAADALGVSLEKIAVEIGDSSLPPACLASGSQTTASVCPAVSAACEMLREDLKRLAIADEQSKLRGKTPEQIAFADGGFYVKGETAQSDSYADILRRNGKTKLEACATAMPVSGKGRGAPGAPCQPAPLPADENRDDKKYSFHSFGAQFVEVWVDEDLGTIRVKRVTSVQDVGRIMNGKTARSQIIGGVIFGIGQALMEESLFDRRWANPVTRTLADYHVPVQMDVPEIDVHFIDEPDLHISPIGARGVGEIGGVGISAAIANAIFNATGKRIRELPITLDKLL